MNAELEQILNLATQPAFLVGNGCVIWCNTAAHALIPLGLPLSLLLDGCEPSLYTEWTGKGTLRLPLRLFGDDYDSNVRRLDEGDLFFASMRRSEGTSAKIASMEILSSSLCQALQSLLNASRTLFDFIQDKADTPTMDAAAQLNRSIYQLNRIYSKLTDGRRLLNHRTEPIRLPTKMQTFLSNFASEAKALVWTVGIRFVYQPLATALSVDVDNKLLLLALYGLLANMLYGARENTTVYLSAEKQAQFLQIRLRVTKASDATPAASNAEQLLTDLHQSGDIGLPMVREIARLHGGSLVLSTDENNSALAVLSLSLAPCELALNSVRLSVPVRSPLHPGLVILSEILPASAYRPDEVE